MKVTAGNIRAWEKLGQKGCVFSFALTDLAKKNSNIRVLSADLSLLSGLDRFCRSFPEQYLQCGIAEQNMMAMAAGLALEGEMVIATTYASFIAVRSLEQIRQNISNNQANVKIVGTFGGFVSAKSGVSHCATEDLAFIRALPYMTVLSPCDSLEAMKAFEAATNIDGPVYLRLSGGINCPAVHTKDFDFEIGKPIEILNGEQVALIATGLMVHEAMDAAKLLEEKGISCAVYDVHTLKPLDYESFDKIFERYKLIATIEEHNIIGGLGSAVAEYKATKSIAPRQVFIGAQDCYYKAGSPRYIWDCAGISAKEIALRIEEEWNHDQK